MILTIVLFSILSLVIIAAVATWREVEQQTLRRHLERMRQPIIKISVEAQNFDQALREAAQATVLLGQAFLEYEGKLPYEEIPAP